MTRVCGAQGDDLQLSNGDERWRRDEREEMGVEKDAERGKLDNKSRPSRDFDSAECRPAKRS
jgi:hypothetical protein